ncbi:hypothetical protein SLEP1_g54503 [Rubroshorea leprosula]|uniref:Uncharacterized protein n=1 Tax=Rubroshorea leprosula TaxID=152421 RepID=A0AAV5MCL1_9ROSI|nr:hypothetical protein SLEP1_g54503 [Rubroshorea leprosula]
MVNIRRAYSERKAPTSPRSSEVGEIDTAAPFQSVKAAVSLFGEVAVVSRGKRTPCTPRRSRLSSENVIDKETQLLWANKELNNIKQKLESAETTKAKALADLERSKRTLQDIFSKLRTVTEAKQLAIQATEAVKIQAKQLQTTKSEQYSESSTIRKQELEGARELYINSAIELDAAKQELNQIRQDFDAALEAKLVAFQQAAEAQRAAKAQSERVAELSKEILAMKEAIQQLKFVTQEALQQHAEILEARDALELSYKNAKEEAERKFLALKKEFDPELTRNLELKLAETTEQVEYLQIEMNKAHASEMDSIRVITKELNEATRTLQRAAEDESSLRNLVCSLKMELDEVRREQVEAKKEAERECIAEKKMTEEDAVKLDKLLSETENARREGEKMKKKVEELKQEAETSRRMEDEIEKKLEIVSREVVEAKQVEKKAVDEMKALSAGNVNRESGGKIKISVEQFESLKKKVEESGPIAEKKVEAAMAELKEINASNEEVTKKLEANLKAIEEIKGATEMTLKSAEMAEAVQSMVESELRKWRQEDEVVA